MIIWRPRYARRGGQGGGQGGFCQSSLTCHYFVKPGNFINHFRLHKHEEGSKGLILKPNNISNNQNIQCYQQNQFLQQLSVNIATITWAARHKLTNHNQWKANDHTANPGNADVYFPFDQPWHQAGMARFKTKISQSRSSKSLEAFIDTVVTHHFFRQSSAFILCTTIEPDSVESVSTTTYLVGKRTVMLPIGTGIIQESHHVLNFSCNMWAGHLLSNALELLFSNKVKNFTG